MTRPLLAMALVVVVHCGKSMATDPRYPARPDGCDVRVFASAPPMPLDNIGTVSASCAESDSDEVCTRQLKDEACKLGGDVVWGVDAPLHTGNKRKLAGRAAHTK
jgi:hypothetical protein